MWKDECMRQLKINITSDCNTYISIIFSRHHVVILIYSTPSVEHLINQYILFLKFILYQLLFKLIFLTYFDTGQGQ